MRDAAGKVIRKENLPIKICSICVRPFNWRKKWERTWADVQTCSSRCLGEARLLRRAAAVAERDAAIKAGAGGCADSGTSLR